MSAPVTIFTTPTCSPCKAAKRQLEAAEIEVEVIDLTQEPAALAALKDRLGAKVIHTPTFEHRGELLEGIIHLRSIIDKEKAA